jgi:hypothetical protein
VLRLTSLYFGLLSANVRWISTDARLGDSCSCFDIRAPWKCRSLANFDQPRILVDVTTPVIFQSKSVGFRRWQPSGAVWTLIHLSALLYTFVELASWAFGNPPHRLFAIFRRWKTLSQPNEWVHGTETKKARDKRLWARQMFSSCQRQNKSRLVKVKTFSRTEN